MLIDQDKCNGCGICVPYCPVGAITVSGKKAGIDLDICAECGTCGRRYIVKCPTAAIYNDPNLFETERGVSKYFSDPMTTHKVTKIPGRGTEEVKTNDVTGRVKRGEIGIALEMGRPCLGTTLAEVQKVTTALARIGIVWEHMNPLSHIMDDPGTGTFPTRRLGLRMISCIIEFTAPAERLEAILTEVRRIAQELDTVFSLDLITQYDPAGHIPVLDQVERLGFAVRPNAKINLGLGRPLAEAQ